MAPSPDDPPRAGRPPRIDRAAVVTRARALIEAEGLAALTMRRLARELEVSPMSLYHHVADKDELLVLVLDAQVADVTFPAPLPDPRARIIAYAAFLRGILDAHPWVLEAITSGERFAPRILPLVESMLEAFHECGLAPEPAYLAYRAVWFQLLGELTYRHAADRSRAADERPTAAARTILELDPEATPLLATATRAWPAVAERYDPDRAVAALVDGLVRHSSNRPYGRPE